MIRLIRFSHTLGRLGLLPNVPGVLLGLFISIVVISHGAVGLSQSIEQGVKQACASTLQR